MLIVASEGQCLACFLLFYFPFPPGFLYNDPSHIMQIRERRTTIIPDLMIKDLWSVISSSERVFRCISRVDTGFCQRLLLRMVVTMHDVVVNPRLCLQIRNLSRHVRLLEHVSFAHPLLYLAACFSLSSGMDHVTKRLPGCSRRNSQN
ncbi:hypothetical protein P692DRAFT_20909154 [Suillus brevipes Sb2]|nr:hypothetical protein P692DRAFT_20909154 [Suillus brevipes Sb2]